MKKFVLMRDVEMALMRNGEEVSCVRTICPEYGYQVHLHDDGKMYLVLGPGVEGIRLKVTPDMEKPGWVREIKEG
jgi:hypothetical protein